MIPHQTEVRVSDWAAYLYLAVFVPRYLRYHCQQPSLPARSPSPTLSACPTAKPQPSRSFIISTTMSNVAGRKKSVASTTGLQIETPIAHSTFLNKSANQSTSLYQQCAQLRTRLLQIQDFTTYFNLSSSQSRSNPDPVSQLWDCFALGAPLCFLHNLMPGVTPISQINTNPDAVDPTDLRASKKAIVHFAMAISHTDLFDQNDQFRATELMDRESTDGFVKVCFHSYICILFTNLIISTSQVVNCVTRLVDRLPEDLFEEDPSTSPPSEVSAQESNDVVTHPASPVTASGDPREASRNNVIREIVFTERKYVQDLEHMQVRSFLTNTWCIFS